MQGVPRMSANKLLCEIFVLKITIVGRLFSYYFFVANFPVRIIYSNNNFPKYIVLITPLPMMILPMKLFNIVVNVVLWVIRSELTLMNERTICIKIDFRTEFTTSPEKMNFRRSRTCLLYTSDAADE